MVRLRPILAALVLACLVPLLLPVQAQVPPVPQPDPPEVPTVPLPVVGGAVNPLIERLVPLLENESQEDLHSERIDLELLIDMRNVDYSLLGILFGGGKVDADVRTELALDFGAVSVVRLDEALQQMTGDANISLNNTFGIDSSRLALTAEEIRLIGGGVLLEAFRGFQEQAARRMIEAMLPGIVVLQADFAWSNTIPTSELRDETPEVSLRDPPIHLDAVLTINYLDRLSAYEIARDAMAEKDARAQAQSDLKRRITENQSVPLAERNAFMFLGYGQLLDVDLPSGWRLNLTLDVPKGFTIEGATDELVLDDARQRATYYVDGSERSEPFATAGVVTVSNRFLVTATAVGAVLLVGFVGRLLIEGLVMTAHGGLASWGERSRPRSAATAGADGAGAPVEPAAPS